THVMHRHEMNRDNDQFVPKPAAVVRMLQGSSQDSALMAWAKVIKAITRFGPYQTVVFDDEIIHAVISDMGGWIKLGQMTEKEQPFRAQEFENRYRALKTASPGFAYPRKLSGITDTTNSANGYPEQTPILVGD